MKRKINHFAHFRNAFVATRREAAVSLLILLFVTFIFTLILWLAESAQNPNYNFWDALVWVLVKYVEDPAEVALAPATVFGQVIGTMVGILGIAIFAVPAGLLGSGLLDAMADEKKQEKTDKNSTLLHKRFRRIAQSSSFYIDKKGYKVSYKGVPRYLSLPYIIMKTGMNDDEIFDVVNNCPDMRLMTTSLSSEANLKDDLVVVNFPLNNEYGCFLDRGSDVTIVSPVSLTEIGTGSFAFSLAAMGGFNYVSKELSPSPDDPFGFYSMRKSKLDLIGEPDAKKDVESQALHFMSDLKNLKERSEKEGRNHWFIFLMATRKSYEDQIYIWRLANDKAQVLPEQLKGTVRYGSTVKENDEQKLQQFYEAVHDALGNYDVTVAGTSKNIAVSLDNSDVFKGVSPSNIMCRVGGGCTCNALTLRVCYEILLQSPRYLSIAKEIADALKNVVEPDREIPESAKKCYLKEGEGYADDFLQTVVFETDPDELRDMIKRKSKEARTRFEHLDLDGNVQAM